MQTPGEPDILVELIDIYLQDSVKYLDKIIEAANSGELDLLKRSIHSLKGSSGNIGARFFAARCDELENSLKQGDIKSAKKLLPQVEIEYNQVRTVLSDYREKRIQLNA